MTDERKTADMLKKILKASLVVLISFLLLVLLVFSSFSFGEKIMFWSFYSNSDKYEKIPGLCDNFVPQGYNKVDGTALRLACGYMSDGSASRIYMMRNGETPIYVEMKNPDGSDNKSHTGGIANLGDYVYITADTGCDVFSLADILDGDGFAMQLFSVNTINNPAYCLIKDEILYCGSFYREGNYETPDEHRITTPAGDRNSAIISAYALDTVSGHTLSTLPDFVISTQGLVQGMTFIDEKTVVLATSYGLAKSHLYFYDIENLQADTNGFEINGETLPLYYLDSSCLKEKLIAPPMAEQIFYENGYIYIMTESASMKYLFGKLTSASYVHGYKYN